MTTCTNIAHPAHAAHTLPLRGGRESVRTCLVHFVQVWAEVCAELCAETGGVRGRPFKHGHLSGLGCRPLRARERQAARRLRRPGFWAGQSCTENAFARFGKWRVPGRAFCRSRAVTPSGMVLGGFRSRVQLAVQLRRVQAARMSTNMLKLPRISHARFDSRNRISEPVQCGFAAAGTTQEIR
jgi:hypothetical protein